jgi:hypothetical protein
MADDVLNYPKAAIAMGNGDLVQVTNFNFDFTNNAKLKHTLRRKVAGVVKGNEEGTLKFDLEIDETGPERDYFNLIKTGEIKQVRAKLPGGMTLVLKGAYQQLSLDQPLDDACKMSLTFICGADKAT